MSELTMPDRVDREASPALIEALRLNSEPLPAPERAAGFGACFDRFGEARIVLLGLADWGGGDRRELAGLLREPLLERAIGVVYRPESERLSHYFEAVMAEQFDAWVWFEQTKAVTPLGHECPHGAPETWPFGL